MSKPNDSSPRKGRLSSSVREKLRLQLPVTTDQLSSEDSGEDGEKQEGPLLREDSFEEADKSKRSQSALQVTYPKLPYFEDEDSDSDFKPSPRFNLSIDSTPESVFVSPYVAFGSDTLPGLRIPSISSLPADNKDQLITSLRLNEHSLETQLSEVLHTLSKTEEKLRIAQIHSQTLQNELETMRKSQTSREDFESMQKKVKEIDREKNDLRDILSKKDLEIGTLKREIKHMDRENKELKEEIKRAEQEKLAMELDNKTLKEQKGILEDSVLSLQRTHQGSFLLSSAHKSKATRNSCSPTKKPKTLISHSFLSPKASVPSQSRVLKELLVLLDLKNSEDLLPCVEKLRQKSRVTSHMQDFIEKLQGVIVDCSPPDAFPATPSLNQMWKWVRRLVEEYMNIRKSTEILQKLLQLLRVKSPTESVSTLTTILNDYEQSVLTLSLLKAKLHIPLASDSQQICAVLDQQLHC